MKVKYTETGDVLDLCEICVIGNAIRIEFASETDCCVEYVYPDDTLEELLDSDGYEIVMEE